MISDEMLLKMMIRTYAFMRRTPNGESAGDLMTLKTKGFGSILDILVKNDGVPQSKITELSNMRQQSVSEALNSLESREYIRREHSHNDKRVSLIYITDRGKTIQKDLKKQREELAKSFFGVLSESEKENLFNILKKLQNQFNKEN